MSVHHPVDVSIRAFEPEDYAPVRALWDETPGVQLTGANEPDGADSPAGIRRFLDRNPGLSFVAVSDATPGGDGEIVGAVMTGTDGRRGYLHHLAVRPDRRRVGIGTALVNRAIRALQAQGIAKTHLFVVAENDGGARFWQRRGWVRRIDLHMYSLTHGAGQ
ncbi:MAG: GNAT family N-acetyltransferase [Spirochaetota bacterium]